MLLSDSKINLRALEPEDLELLYDWENMPQFWDTGNTRQPYSRFELKQYISQINKDIYESRQLRLMICDSATQQAVGTVDLFNFDPYHSRIELGLFVAPEFKGKGFATSALHLIEEYVFSFLKIHQLYSYIAGTNLAGITMFTKENFSSVKLTSWIRTVEGYEDVVLFQQFATNYRKPE